MASERGGMMDLISRSALIENFKKSGIVDSEDDAWVYSFAIAMIESTPTVDAVPVVHGKRLYNGFVKEWECSECHSSISLSDDRNSHPNFCPNCGADMRKKVQE